MVGVHFSASKKVKENTPDRGLQWQCSSVQELRGCDTPGRHILQIKDSQTSNIRKFVPGELYYLLGV